MNYSRNIKKKSLGKRIVISWLIFLAIGLFIGFLLGFAVKAVSVDSSEGNAPPTNTPEIVIQATPAATLTPVIPVETKPPEPLYISLGEYKLTAYCPCEKCCGVWGKDRPLDDEGKPIVITASGAYAKEGVTVAADTSILPFGTVVIIDGNEYIVQDRGGAVKGNKIDIYFESHKEALEFGVQYKEIFIVERSSNND